jgi:hypothetical protein
VSNLHIRVKAPPERNRDRLSQATYLALSATNRRNPQFPNNQMPFPLRLHLNGMPRDLFGPEQIAVAGAICCRRFGAQVGVHPDSLPASAIMAARASRLMSSTDLKLTLLAPILVLPSLSAQRWVMYPSLSVAFT